MSVAAAHVPRIAPDNGVADAARAALGKALLEVKDAVGELSLTVDARRAGRGDDRAARYARASNTSS